MIRQVQLKDFRSHVLTNIVFEPFTLFLGAMGAGKSSVLHSIAVTLVGQDPIINAKGEGLAREIRSGEKEFHVGVKLDPGGLIDRKFAEGRHSIGIDGNYAGVRQQQGRILERLKCSEDVILALLDPTPFFSREEKTQRKVLLQFMSNKEIMAPTLVRKLGLAESFQSVGQVDLLIKEIKEDKVRTLNREIDTLQKQITEPVEFDPTLKVSLEKLLVDLRRQRDELIRKQSREEEWNRTLKTLEADLVTVQQGGLLADLQKIVKDSAATEAEGRKVIIGLKKEYKETSDKLTERQGEKAKWEGDINRLSETMNTVTGMGKKCGVVDRFECPLKEAEKKKMIRQLEDDMKELKEGLEVLVLETQDLARKVADLEATGKAKTAEIEAAVKLQSQTSSRIVRINQATASLDQHRKTPVGAGNWAEELKDVAGKIAGVEIDIAGLTKAQDDASRRSLQVADVRDKQARAEELKSAADELAKLKETLLAESSGGFVQAMKGFLATFGLGEVEFHSEPFGFTVNGLYADQLSGGQKVVVEAALRVAAAKSSGLNIMALDDANKLGEKARQKMAGLLAGAGIQAIVCSTTEIEPAGGIIPPGMAIYWFQNPSIVGPTSVRKLG